MDILDKLHTIADKRQNVLFALDADAPESDRIKALSSFNDETILLHEIASYIYSEQAKGKCQNKSCPHYALGQANGCTIYDFISICVDAKRGD